jgi:hypothetical protein
VVATSAIDESIERKRVSHIEDAIRRRQIKEVKIYMKKVYNPIYYNTKPRYRKQLTDEEKAFLKKALKGIYNPKLMQRDNIFTEIRKIAET